MSTSFSDFTQVTDFLYTQLPQFQRVGASAYKKDLSNTIRLCEFLNFPQHQFKSVHIAGTNGKGSTSHMIASVMQKAGYRTGLYTSPHLKSYTERIKINGQEIPEVKVVDFVNRIRPIIDEIQPSFFEITVAMAFDYFAEEQVDIAIVEVGMGGRLDSTNLIIPEVSVITNISLDHQQWLGDTVELIAKEKAGIIKERVPVIVSQRQEGIDTVIQEVAETQNSSILFASDHYAFRDGIILKDDEEIVHVQPDLKGHYQQFNICGAIAAIDQLNQRGFIISEDHIKEGLSSTISTTGLKGRWQMLQTEPTVVCDVGHNEAGVKLILEQLEKIDFERLHIVWGMVNDKEVSTILKLLPKEANYYFTQATIPRAMPADELLSEAKENKLDGVAIKGVNNAFAEAIKNANTNDLIFVGGSTFVVADLDIL